MFDTCTLAVFSETNSCSPICRFVCPVATRDRTSASRAVRPSRSIEVSSIHATGASTLSLVRREIASMSATTGSQVDGRG